ncbi:unnamed protein product [Brassica rapa subsp. trilocularis]
MIVANLVSQTSRLKFLVLKMIYCTSQLVITTLLLSQVNISIVFFITSS